MGRVRIVINRPPTEGREPAPPPVVRLADHPTMTVGVAAPCRRRGTTPGTRRHTGDAIRTLYHPHMPVDLLVVLLVILVLVLMWRGPKSLPKLGEALGRGVREARSEAAKAQDEIQSRMGGADEPPKSGDDQPT